MPGYKELREEYEVTTTESGVSGVRVFISLAAGLVDLPVLGDPFSVIYPACLLRSIHVEKYHVLEGETGCDADGLKYVCDYNTAEVNIYRPVLDRDAEQINFSAGTEVWSVKDPKFWYWQPDAASVFTTGEIEQRLFKNTVRGTVSKTVTYPVSGTTFGNWMYNTVNVKLGKINDNYWLAMDGSGAGAGADTLFNPGTVLFSSYQGKMVLDEDGDRIWEITLNFSYRLLTVGDPSDPLNWNVDDSWHYLLREDKFSDGENDWQKPCKLQVPTNTIASRNKDYLYARTSFIGLL